MKCVACGLKALLFRCQCCLAYLRGGASKGLLLNRHTDGTPISFEQCDAYATYLFCVSNGCNANFVGAVVVEGNFLKTVDLKKDTQLFGRFHKTTCKFDGR